MKDSARFILPEKGIFKPNNQDDPLPFYYKPAIGHIFRARIEQGLSLLSPPYPRILEIGYGSGVLLPSLARLGEHVTAIDIASDPEKVGKSLERMGITCTLIRGDVKDYPFDGQEFNLIVAFSVLEHIKNPKPLFGRFQQLLAPNGVLLVGMPRVDKLMQKAFSLIGFKGIEKHHVTNYSECIKAAEKYFILEKRAHIPSFLPETLGLYFNILFSKK